MGIVTFQRGLNVARTDFERVFLSGVNMSTANTPMGPSASQKLGPEEEARQAQAKANRQAGAAKARAARGRSSKETRRLDRRRKLEIAAWWAANHSRGANVDAGVLPPGDVQ
jgi:hypothetical protein